ncbi:hypothetical protein MMAN_26690 [Mycobacterium mantenii]|uniref:Uncharacterized protein n=1 Tax=Mycobacterium mantenii TaxID=560555 RepID=A0ABM7JSK7_MYCNT|nr:hypothetical protein MMAN_26690 [Mycobacterium mantenii]
MFSWGSRYASARSAVFDSLVPETVSESLVNPVRTFADRPGRNLLSDHKIDVVHWDTHCVKHFAQRVCWPSWGPSVVAVAEWIGDDARSSQFN